MSTFDASYSLAYVEVRRKQSGQIVHGYVWAAWWNSNPTSGEWRSADAQGVVEQTEMTNAWAESQARAEIAADDACREAFEHVRHLAKLRHELAGGPAPFTRSALTRRIDDAYARAAERERLGRPANFRAPKPSRYATPPGFSRPPAMAARAFFAAAPPSEPTNEALSYFGLDHEASAADVQRVYRERVKVAHPDRGGVGGDSAEMKRRRDEALRAVGASI